MKHILSFFVTVLILSCSSKQIGQWTLFEEGQWPRSKEVSISHEVKDPSQLVDITFAIKVTKDYAFSNLYLISEIIDAKGEVEQIDTLEYKMADEYGRLLGEGLFTTKESGFSYKERYRFKEQGLYTIRVTHAMRQLGSVKPIEYLQGILGFAIFID